MTQIRVLLADDHAVFRSGIRALLEREADFEIVAETGTGPQTLAALDEHEVDVLLLDVSMPELSGPRVAEAALRKKPRLAIVVLTMHEDEYYLQELLRIGARSYVLKKSTGTELLQAIRASRNGDSYVDPALAMRLISPYVGKAGSDAKTRLDLLTQREQEVCSLIAYGFTNVEVAGKLFISDRTVETHRTNIMSKLGLNSRAELVRFAIDNGLLKLD
jgi:DNA-binding NarL/FixJ family response regulator